MRSASSRCPRSLKRPRTRAERARLSLRCRRQRRHVQRPRAHHRCGRPRRRRWAQLSPREARAQGRPRRWRRGPGRRRGARRGREVARPVVLPREDPYTAERGGNGRGTRKHGADGDDIELRVPVGTQVFEDGGLVVDLAHAGARAVVARGGSGGRGNARFATPTRQAPRFAETGLGGETRELELQLKLLADAALAGLPNAGKSSLLRRISNAKPKVADYPFTTIAPVLGTVARARRPAADRRRRAGPDRRRERGHRSRARVPRAPRAGATARARDRRVGGRRRRAVRHDRPRAGPLRRRARGAAAARRPQQVGSSAGARAVLGRGRAYRRGREGLVRDRSRDRRAQAGAVPACVPRGATAQDAPAELPEFLEYRPAPPRRQPFRVLRTHRGFRVVGEIPGDEELEAALRVAGVRQGAEVEIGDEVFEWE